MNNIEAQKNLIDGTRSEHHFVESKKFVNSTTKTSLIAVFSLGMGIGSGAGVVIGTGIAMGTLGMGFYAIPILAGTLGVMSGIAFVISSLFLNAISNKEIVDASKTSPEIKNLSLKNLNRLKKIDFLIEFLASKNIGTRDLKTQKNQQSDFKARCDEFLNLQIKIFDGDISKLLQRLPNTGTKSFRMTFDDKKIQERQKVLSGASDLLVSLFKEIQLGKYIKDDFTSFDEGNNYSDLVLSALPEEIKGSFTRLLELLCKNYSVSNRTTTRMINIVSDILMNGSNLDRKTAEQIATNILKNFQEKT